MRDPGNLDETVSGVRDGGGEGPSAAFTPGPWEASQSPSDARRWFVQGAGIHWGDICELFNDNRAANARLIAAAPDLLAALQRVVGSWLGDHAPRHDDWDVARAAIAKALIAQAADTSARNVPAREGQKEPSSSCASPSPPVAARHGSDASAKPSGKED